MSTKVAPITNEQKAVDAANQAGFRVRHSSPSHIDVEIRTVANSYASVAISLTERRFGGLGFNPQGWTLQHFLSTNAAMAQLISLAVTLWDLCEVPSC